MDGIGLHSGRYVRMSICPAPANHGIKFRRTDVADRRQTITAHADFAEQSRLCTRIVNDDGVGLETIEHLMAGFAGIGLDNALVEIDAAEAPILDGSSQPVIEALGDVGLELLPAKRKYLTLLKTVEVVLDDQRVKIKEIT
jgi:UDP-3-O-[3-hydroxymyristoyl] N-acetylglucosamine deacetylase